MKNLLFLILVFSYGCTSKKAETISVLDLLSLPSNEIFNLSEIASEIDYVPLQTSQNCLIQYIFNIKTNENSYYINTLSEIMCFDKTGHFLYKLDNKGRGPGEFTNFIDYDVSSENDLLIVLVSGRILIFKNRGDGFDFSKSLSHKQPGPSKLDFVPGQNSILLSYGSSYGNEPHRNALLSLFGDTLNSRSNFNKYKKLGKLQLVDASENIIFKFNNILHFKEMFSDTVFTIDKSNKFRPYLILDSHGKRPTGQDRANSEYFIEHVGEFIYLTRFFEVSRYYIYSFDYDKSMRSFITEKSSNKKSEISAKAFLVDDITGGINFEPKFCSGDKLYSWVDALVLKKHVSSETFLKSFVKNPNKKKALKELADSLKETDNPILIVVTPKE